MELPWKNEPVIAPISATNPESPSSITISSSSDSSQQQSDKDITKTEQSLSEPIPPVATLDNEVSPSISISPPEKPLDTDGDSSQSTTLPLQETPVQPKRVLHLRNFLQAQREITPSSSESFGSLAELRKWNEEFGEGRRDRKRRQVWGKGQFGFVEHGIDRLEEGRVAQSQPKL